MSGRYGKGLLLVGMTCSSRGKGYYRLCLSFITEGKSWPRIHEYVNSPKPSIHSGLITNKSLIFTSLSTDPVFCLDFVEIASLEEY